MSTYVADPSVSVAIRITGVQISDPSVQLLVLGLGSAGPGPGPGPGPSPGAGDGSVTFGPSTRSSGQGWNARTPRVFTTERVAPLTKEEIDRLAEVLAVATALGIDDSEDDPAKVIAAAIALDADEDEDDT